MRAGWLMLLLLIPSAHATPPTEPYAFDARLDADPIVGRTVTLTVRIDARTPLDAPIRLEAPAWVAIEEPREQHARVAGGDSAEHAWRLTPQRAGFWHASLSVDASRAGAYGNPIDPSAAWQSAGGCCIHAWSAARDGLFSMSVDDAIPKDEDAAKVDLAFAALDAGRAQATVRIEPRAEWLAGEEFLVSFPMGAKPQRAPADAPRQFVESFELGDGAAAVLNYAASIWVTFEDGLDAVDDPRFARDVGCANVHLERTGDEVREVRRDSCYATPDRPRLLPGPGLLAVAIVLLCAKGLSTRR